ncbi:MAG: hypothetical protein MJE68_28380, partial [Proteobacteria bacterium]|nr:hypothetical protein [Pseudomonadota bacterium]
HTIKNTGMYIIVIQCVIGFCSNGEHNAMQNQGYTRPLSIIKIRGNVRLKYAKMSKKQMISMLSPTCMLNAF